MFAICVSASQKSSMESISRWIAEIKSKVPDRPMCLVMTKRDLLDEVD